MFYCCIKRIWVILETVVKRNAKKKFPICFLATAALTLIYMYNRTTVLTNE